MQSYNASIRHLQTVARAVVRLDPKFHLEGKRFFVKDRPKDKEWLQFELADHLVATLGGVPEAPRSGRPPVRERSAHGSAP